MMLALPSWLALWHLRRHWPLHPTAERYRRAHQGVTDVVVLGICNGVSRRSEEPSALTSASPPRASAMYLLGYTVVNR